MADAVDLKSTESNLVRVQISFPALEESKFFLDCFEYNLVLSGSNENNVSLADVGAILCRRGRTGRHARFRF